VVSRNIFPCLLACRYKLLLPAYVSHKGNIDQIMAVVIMAEDEHDQKRIEDIIAKAVKVKKLFWK
jgi:hypothetical protein